MSWSFCSGRIASGRSCSPGRSRSRGPSFARRFHSGPTLLYSWSAVEQGARALERRLQAEGFLSARVQPAVTLDRQKFAAQVTYAIEPGPAALAAEPFFDGDPAPFTAADLASRMRMKPGSPYRESAARADASRIEEFLHGKERYRATVELIAAQPIEDGRVMPVYRLRVGPHVTFEATGIKPEKLAKELHALAESRADRRGAGVAVRRGSQGGAAALRLLPGERDVRLRCPQRPVGDPHPRGHRPGPEALRREGCLRRRCFGAGGDAL